MKSLQKVLGENFRLERIDAAYIKIDEKKFRKFSKEKIEKAVPDLKDKKKK